MVGEELDKLTRREKDVMVLVSAGFSNAKISTILGISYSTTKVHLSRVYEKLGVKNRVAASYVFNKFNYSCSNTLIKIRRNEPNTYFSTSMLPI